MHLTAFQFHSCGRCPIHLVRLVDRCPECGCEIPYRLRADTFRAPFNCPSCSRAWIRAARGLDDLRVSDAYRRRLSECSASGDLIVRSVADGYRFGLGGRHGMQAGKTADEWTVLRPTESGQEQPCSHAPTRDALSSLEGLLSQACARYKAVRRSIVRVYDRQHRACIATAMRLFMETGRAHDDLLLSGRTGDIAVAHEMGRGGLAQGAVTWSSRNRCLVVAL